MVPYQLPEGKYFLFFLFGKREMIFGVMEWLYRTWFESDNWTHRFADLETETIVTIEKLLSFGIAVILDNFNKSVI